MNSLPQELLDEAFLHVIERHQPVTERFETFTPTSLHTILTCRLVARRWLESETLISIFVWVLQETTFAWHSHRIPALEAISELPKYARWFGEETTLSIRGMDMALLERGEYERWGPGRDRLDEQRLVVPYLVHLLRRFSWVEHLRFYPIHPRCLKGTWPTWEVSNADTASFETCFIGSGRARYEHSPLAKGEYSWYGVQREGEWIFPRIMEACWNSNLWLKSVETPLFGNRASYCATSWLFEWFPTTSTRVAITTTRSWPQGTIINEYLDDYGAWNTWRQHCLEALKIISKVNGRCVGHTGCRRPVLVLVFNIIFSFPSSRSSA
jgi:hypothetical protein